MTGDDILAAAELCDLALRPVVDADWTVGIPGLEFTVASVVAHAAAAPLWYSVDLWSGTADAAFEVLAHSDATNERLLTSLIAGSRVLAAVVDDAPPGQRGFHPFGSPDPSGFAAMACDELLVHGHDAARGLGISFSGDRRLSTDVLARLFPWHVPGPDDHPWLVLLWANGRLDLPGRPMQHRWRWQPAPLVEWDGNAP